MVNPGHFSLFTGRADNTEELLHPTLLARELFEELILFRERRLYRPHCRPFSGIIDQVYTRLETDLGLNIAAAQPLHLEHLMCTPKMLTVTNRGNQWQGKLDYYVNSNGEVNVLFVFAGAVDIDKLQAIDGEYHMTDGRANRQNRSIYLYDLHTAMGKDITMESRAGELVPIPSGAMTEHLYYLVESLKRKLAIDNPLGKLMLKQGHLQS
jgi:hypothetical protein